MSDTGDGERCHATERKRRWFQFHLSTLLIFVLMISTCMTLNLAWRNDVEYSEEFLKQHPWMTAKYSRVRGWPFVFESTFPRRYNDTARLESDFLLSVDVVPWLAAMILYYLMVERRIKRYDE